MPSYQCACPLTLLSPPHEVSQHGGCGTHLMKVVWSLSCALWVFLPPFEGQEKRMGCFITPFSPLIFSKENAKRPGTAVYNLIKCVLSTSL
jgi:hypothetical protein